ncbi:hypothetical protein ATANTOWER_027178 [Ataeniobius toweri]|uniref:PiggyBac transposable element-derived protein domain-containing protein n=1 Tax=Ataeniobius toweri TaxID=208326 RepID=A0ABU7ATH9_9TELE|nr:hypothetical protein [Ataeniobius toweri]
MFFPEDILEVVVEQSNLYAIQCDTNKPLNLTTKELEQFMGTAVYMSLFGLPGTRMFWNKATRVSQVANTSRKSSRLAIRRLWVQFQLPPAICRCAPGQGT